MRSRLALAVLAAVPALVACGGVAPDKADEVPATDVLDESTSPTGTPSDPTSTAPTEPVDLGDEPLVELSGQEICDALSVDDATLALGTEVAQAETSESQTPQCTYTYGGDSATLSTFTVAAQRPDDVGSRGLGEAFDYVLDLNRGLATDSGVEEVAFDAGDRAVRLTGDTLTLSVVASGGRLLTIITTPDLDATAVEALGAAAADAVE